MGNGVNLYVISLFLMLTCAGAKVLILLPNLVQYSTLRSLSLTCVRKNMFSLSLTILQTYLGWKLLKLDCTC